MGKVSTIQGKKILNFFYQKEFWELFELKATSTERSCVLINMLWYPSKMLLFLQLLVLETITSELESLQGLNSVF